MRGDGVEGARDSRVEIERGDVGDAGPVGEAAGDLGDRRTAGAGGGLHDSTAQA